MEFEKKIRIHGRKIHFDSKGTLDERGNGSDAESEGSMHMTMGEYITKKVGPLLRQGAGRQLLEDTIHCWCTTRFATTRSTGSALFATIKTRWKALPMISASSGRFCLAGANAIPALVDTARRADRNPR
ncbi:hypothetical protein RRF57_011373 [Xylaria bambusicola]|uniref:Uncharacterized protein n=1 Tax=Xylaria bambusicola TaxID=326684 RepID=A0AAN7ZD54_9PEZI